MNFITNLSLSRRNEIVYDLILIVVDCYIKMTRYLSTRKTLTTVELAKLFFKEVILRYEVFKKIIINRDSLFINAF